MPDAHDDSNVPALGDELSAAPEDRLSDEEWASYIGALAELRTDPTEELRRQLAAATARIAELESEREADARAVNALLEAEHWDVIGTARARAALRDRFADGKAALNSDSEEEI